MGITANSRKVAILRALIDLGGDALSSEVKDYLDSRGIFMNPAAVRTNLVRYARRGLICREKGPRGRGYFYFPGTRTLPTIRYYKQEHKKNDYERELLREGSRQDRQTRMNLMMLVHLMQNRVEELERKVESTVTIPDVILTCADCRKEVTFSLSDLKITNGMPKMSLLVSHRC